MISGMFRAMSGWWNCAARAKVRAISRAVSDCIESTPNSTPAELRARLQRALITLEREDTYIVVSGLFTAGKSTLINRLAHWDILPSCGFLKTGAPALLRQRTPRAARAVRHDGSVRDIEASPDSIATETSLYMADGRRRALDELAKSIELDVPALKLGSHCVLIDLPGLRDMPDLDEVALHTAMEADLLVWVFRSEPAFSEQDREFLGLLVDRCGQQVVQLVLNVRRADSDVDGWGDFLRKGLLAHKTGLEKHVCDGGLEQRHVDGLIVVDAVKLRLGWFGETFGGRELHALLRAMSRKNWPDVQVARIARVASAIDAYACWLGPYLKEAERIFEEEHFCYTLFREAEQWRALLQKKASCAVDNAFKGLDNALDKAADEAAARVTNTGFEADRDVATPLIHGAASLLEARVSQLVVDMTTIASSPETDSLSAKNVSTIVNAFAFGDSDLEAHGEDAIATAVTEEIGEVVTSKPTMSVARVLSWLGGRDSGVEDAAREARCTLRSRAKSFSKTINNRKSMVQAVVAGSLHFRPLQKAPEPDPSQLDQLKASMQNIFTARELLMK